MHIGFMYFYGDNVSGHYKVNQDIKNVQNGLDTYDIKTCIKSIGNYFNHFCIHSQSAMFTNQNIICHFLLSLSPFAYKSQGVKNRIN